MVKKLVLIGMCILILLSTGVFGVLKDINGNSCSTTPSDYLFFNESVKQLTTNAQYDFTDIADDEKYTIFIKNIDTNTVNSDNPYLLIRGTTSAENQAYLHWRGAGPLIRVDSQDTTIPPVADLQYNFSFSFNRIGTDEWNCTVNNGSASDTKTGIAFNFDSGTTTNYIDFTDGGSIITLEGVYIWNDSINSGKCPASASVPSYGNVEITAFSLYNNYSLRVFNVTVNGTTYTTTNGTVVTSERDGTYQNFTFKADHFESVITDTNNTFRVYSNQTVLTGINQEIKYGTTRVGYDIKQEINYTNTTNYQVNLTYYRNNVNGSTSNSSTTNANYTFESKDFLDYMNFTVQLCTNYLCQNSTHNSIAENTIDLLLTFNVTSSYTSTSLSSVDMKFLNEDKNYTNNPISFLASDILSSDNKTKNVTIQVIDLNSLHVSKNFTQLINETTTYYSLQLTAYNLILNFTQLGSAKSTSGYVADEEKSLNFTNSSLIIVQQNLTEGYVHIRFGQNSVGTNHTQFYEYINDNTEQIFEEIEILQDATWYAYFRVQSYTGSLIKDAKIRLEFSKPSSNIENYTYHKLLGQRLTGDDGITMFYADPNSEVKLTVTKDGYEDFVRLLTIGDYTFERSDPFIIDMKESTTTIKDLGWIMFPVEFTNRTDDYYGTLFLEGYTTVEFTTAYRTTQGLGRKDISALADSLSRYIIKLESGTDFSVSGSDNITFYLYGNTNLLKTINIPYEVHTNYLFPLSTFKTFNNKYLKIILFISLIMLSFATSLIIETREIGVTVFKFGALILFLLTGAFGWMALMILIWIALENGVNRLLEQ